MGQGNFSRARVASAAHQGGGRSSVVGRPVGALVEQVSRDAKRVAASVRGDGESSQANTQQLLDSVDAWQDVIVNKPGHCAECNAELKRGQRAYRGLSQLQGRELPPIWLCPHCIETL